MRVCAEPGCPNVVDRGRCPKHQRTKQRDPFYATPEWRRLQSQVIREEPVCRRCGQAASTDAAHIIARKQRPDLALERSNVEGSCHRCHSRETMSETNARRQADRFLPTTPSR
jgi:5-methylcytosine-specific restriction endonuclease McrA